MELERFWRDDDGLALPALVWRPGPGRRMVSSAMVGGGITPAAWVLNAQVPSGYARMDPAEHLQEIAAARALTGSGVGMLTAADVTQVVLREDEGVHAAATVGLGLPTWAAQPAEVMAPRVTQVWHPGTINILVAVPTVLSDAALVNAVVTATEAKTQALLEAGYACTGTASDAICIAAYAVTPDTAVEPFAGPRSTWGARIARAVHATVLAGALSYHSSSPQADQPPAAEAADR